MKHRVKHFINLTVALKEIEPFVRDGQHLYTGKPLQAFGGLRSRELLANWLMCAILNEGHPDEPYTFTSDPLGGDGIIYDREAELDWPTEHVFIPRAKDDEQRDIATLIHDAVVKKQEKGGAAYASGKLLVVFLEAGLGEWKPNVAARGLPKNDFREIWVVGLHGPVTDRYVYGVCRLKPLDGDSPVWHVAISAAFDTWSVTRVQ